ncbi:DUF5677 domain-containing protein [Cupriavidus pampae]|uniref:Uncharacterized protein n=1 Tax=Cupriavidus pampae TaxID=659251 RepID=A0ABM8XUJ3_9BURK|nr:DUF5677 domain-containing protein [Cupriavidus pampae]CAG9184033.1 hypothetical protein LMG32289_05491 [Cupriavidus pampae]
MDDLQIKGFLSPAMAEQRALARQKFAEDFRRCEHESERAMARLCATEVAGMSAPTLFATAYWVKCLRACQGAILQAEFGMLPEAQTLVRGAVESLFYAVALVRRPELVLRLEDHDAIERRKQAGGMLKVPTIMQHVGDATRAQLEALASDRATRDFPTYEAAEAAGLLELYQTLYRGFSRGAAHSTLKALDHELIREADGSLTLNFGPSYDALPDTLEMIGVCLRAGIDALDGQLVPVVRAIQ